MRRGDLTDEQWQRLEPPLLPPEKPWTGRPNEDHRQILNGILWIDRTGAPWRDLPRHYGPVGTVSSRFYRWREAGIWQRILSARLIHADGRFASYSSLKRENFPVVARDESKQIADRLRRRRFTQRVTQVPKQTIEFFRC